MNISNLLKRLLVAGIAIPSVSFSIIKFPLALQLFLVLLSFNGMKELVFFRHAISLNISSSTDKNSKEHKFPPQFDGFQLYARCVLSTIITLSSIFSNQLISSSISEAFTLIFIIYIISILLICVGTIFGVLHSSIPYEGNTWDIRLVDLVASIFDVYGLFYIGVSFACGSLFTVHYPFLMLLTLLGNWSADGMALFFGKMFGKYKILGPLHKKLSPNKTNEGALGALIGSILASLLYKFLCDTYIPHLWKTPSTLFHVFYGLLIGILAIIGDLVESYIKRVSNVKDSGQFFSSHGGVLDRCDGLLFTFPCALFYCYYFMN
mmetsp:Transcript_5442/g.8033  ORF Transcript_5442/g.8033 Transcript_5442/m.8033 type:complete len:321 (-) Transcript_5442:1942-2904(-)